MKKRFIMVLFVIIISLTMSQASGWSADVKLGGDKLFIESFKNSGAKFSHANINAWLISEYKFQKVEALNSQLNSILKTLGISGKDGKTLKIQKNDYNQLTFEYYGKGKSLTVTLQSLNYNNKPETYVMVDEYLLEEKYSVEKEKQVILKSFGLYKKKPRVSITMVGWFDGKLSDPKMQEKSKEILKFLKAKEIEGIKEEDFMSRTAYTDYIKEYIRLGSDKININLAMRYSPVEERTYLWLATPIIGTEY